MLFETPGHTIAHYSLLAEPEGRRPMIFCGDAVYTFETLETMQAPFDDNIVVLCRNYATRIHPGDYGFMIGNGATSVPYTD